MPEICPNCGLPKDICSCEIIAREEEKIKISVEKKRYGKTYWGNERTSFLIDQNGKIEAIFRKVNPKEHNDQVLAALNIA